MKHLSKYRLNLLSLSVLLIFFLLNGCGGASSGNSSAGSGTSGSGGKSGAAGINGRLVMSNSWDDPHFVSLFSVDIKAGNAQNIDVLGVGHGPNIGADGSIIYVQKCQPIYNNRLVIVDRKGLVTPVSSCSNRIFNPPDSTQGGYDYISPKFSPDQKKIAVSLITTNMFAETVYPIVAVFDRDDVDIQEDLTKLPSVKLYRGYNAFAWKPDGSLLLIGSGWPMVDYHGDPLKDYPTIKPGIYVTDKNLNNPVRIENKINSPVFRPDVNKAGTKVTYHSNNNIFIMDLATGTPKKIRAITKGKLAYTPVWSPNGKYIAYAQREEYEGYYSSLFFYELSSKKIIEIPIGKEVSAPLSWITIPK